MFLTYLVEFEFPGTCYNPFEIFLGQVRGLPTLYFISPDPTKNAIRTEGLIPIQMMRDIIDNEM